MKRRTFLQSLGTIGILAGLPRSTRAHVPRPSLRIGDSEVDATLHALIDAALRNGASYADARFVTLEDQSIQVQSQQSKTAVASAIDTRSSGIALRVWKNGNWGHAAIDRNGIDVAAMATRACALADAMASIARVPFIGEGRIANTDVEWHSPCTNDPFAIPLKDREDFLRRLTATASKHEEVVYAVANLFVSRRTVRYANSLGGHTRQTTTVTYPNCGVTVFDEKARTIDSRSTRFEPASIGYEITEKHDFIGEVEQAVLDILQYQSSPQLPEGDYELILEPSHLWRVIYDSLVPWLDPAVLYGLDASDPARRLLAVSDLGKRKLGSALMNLRFDNTLKHGLATSGWDDAGFAAAPHVIVREGKLQTLPTTDDLTGWYDGPRIGNTRSAGWLAPRFSMPNLVLDPPATSVSIRDMVKDVENGLIVSGRARTYLSPGRTGFQANGQIVRRIQKGVVTGMVRDVVYETRIVDFWRKLTALGPLSEVLAGGEMTPQRSNPQWEAPFSIVTPPARFDPIRAYSIKHEAAQ